MPPQEDAPLTTSQICSDPHVSPTVAAPTRIPVRTAPGIAPIGSRNDLRGFFGVATSGSGSTRSSVAATVVAVAVSSANSG